MAGKKGRSGRRPLSVEVNRLRIIDKAWELVGEALNSPTWSLRSKVALAEKLVAREISKSTGDQIVQILVSPEGVEAKRAKIETAREAGILR